MPIIKKPDAEPIRGYRLLEPLGSGGFGEVWKCEAPGGICKAIKFVCGDRRGLQNDGARADEELRAIQLIKSIRHPFLLSMDRVEIADDELLIITELADQNLDDLLARYRAHGSIGVPRHELLGYLREAAEVLDLLNLKFNLQHLDIKPRNLFLVGNHVKVADFGLVNTLGGAEDDRIQVAAITPSYASPELFQGKLSRQSDLYSLAVVYQELLTGKLPFAGRNSRQLLLQHTKEAPDLTPLPDEDRPHLARALAKNPEDRFPSCMDFIRALQGQAAGPGAASAHVPLPPLAAAETIGNSGHVTQRHSTQGHSTQEHCMQRKSPTLLPNLPPGVLTGYRVLESMGGSHVMDAWKVRSPAGDERLVKYLYGYPSAYLDRLKRDVARLEAINHPALVPVEIVHTEPGRVILATDAMDSTLRERFLECQSHKLPGIPHSELMDYVRAAAEVLDYLYQQHAVQHLGINPRTLVLDGGWLRIVDYGLEQLLWLPAGEHVAWRNARYSAPELFEKSLHRSCDQYSLAVLYTELLTGVHPFASHLTAPRKCVKPSLSMLSPTDREVIARAIDSDPAKRWPSCTDMVLALEGTRAEPEQDDRGDADPFLRLIQMPRTVPPSLNREHASGDLRRSIADIIQGIGGKAPPRERENVPELSEDGDLVTYKFVVGLPLGSARSKLEKFAGQWLGQYVRDDESGPLIRIGLPKSRWLRWLGSAPSLEVAVRLSRVQFRSATPIEVVVEIRAPGTAPAQGRRFLEDMSPLLIDSLRNLLVADSEKRVQERLSWPQPLKVTPVLPDGTREPAVECRGKDICLAGLGFYLPHALQTTEVLIELPNPFHPPALFIPATLVRAKRCADGWYEAGALFRLAALKQTGKELQMAR